MKNVLLFRKENTGKIVGVLKKHDVTKAGIFGSYARGEANSKSDVDILIRFKGTKSLLDLVGLKLELEEMLEKKVHLITYQSINPLIKKNILLEEKRIL